MRLPSHRGASLRRARRSARAIAAGVLASALPAIALAGSPVLSGSAVPSTGAEDRFPRAAASYLVAIDGRVAWARRADEPRSPASLTKIMTALVLLEGDWRADAVVEVSARAAAETGSRAGLRAGEKARAGELLAAMLVASSNDACRALAEHAAGGADAFVAAMNARAASLQLGATRFADPCGHDAPDQRSSAADLATLAEAALARPEFARIVAQRSARIVTAGGRRISLSSSNHLLGTLPGVAGVKTGFTSGAGKCLVVLAERDGTRVLVVLLDAADRWWTAAAIVEEAFRAARARN